MNGPEHYREAERLIAEVNAVHVVHVAIDLTLEEADTLKAQVEEKIGKPVVVVSRGVRLDPTPVLAAAQVHAILAAAAAYADADPDLWAGCVR